MKVLVFTTLYPNHLQPNNGIFIKQRMSHFAQLDECQTKVVAPVPYCPPLPIFKNKYIFSQIATHEDQDGIDVFHPRYPLIPKISMLFHGFSLFLSSLCTVKKLKQNFNFDLIDGHYIYPDGFAAALLAKYFKVPYTLSARGSDINQVAEFSSIRPFIKYALNGANQIISVCNALKQDMVRLGINPDKITVIPNGVDSKNFHPLEKNEARQELNIPAESKIILSVGGLIPRKNFEAIIDVMPSLLPKIPNLKLFIIGKGPHENFLHKKISNLQLTNNVHLLGEKLNKDLCLWYNASDVFCLASTREGWANVLMESLACGTPVVANNVYGAPEIISSPDLGILVEQNAQSMCSGITEALTRNWDRTAILNLMLNKDWHHTAHHVQSVFRLAVKQ